ncbi:LRR receptor-like serine/threonine-protein kinase EFR [Senna tora]|uniref:LRR receptor-like serine/threonine-protein kinase EFR n=1 Tax=Senna tora TaxID=362788 RepID=A0A834TQG7_9FABA|nr:LRR receptor-like serine/threonine-protein kinase EFR [Senna tora]
MVVEKTLREYAAPLVNQAPLCIATHTLQAPLELKSGLIHLLPKFRGLMNEDPYQHMKEFHVVCSSMKPERVTEEQIKLRAFPISLDGAAKEGLFYLPTVLRLLILRLLELHQQENLGIVLSENHCLRKPKESSNTAQVEQERLITTLREYKDAIGRVITDVKGLNPSTFMQRIILEENYKPSQEAKIHLNHAMIEVFKKEFQKLLDTNVNYPILDSKLGSKVQLMPKNISVIVMENSEL